MEARTQHSRARILSQSAPLVVGIDLGTTNSALAWVAPRRGTEIFDVPQLVAAGEIARRPTLPSFLYFTDAAQRDSGAVRLPWNRQPDIVAGVFAREEGALAPARMIASAKSWLSNPHVDRTAALLPWGADGGVRISPVEASALVLTHLRDAWNHDAPEDGPRPPLEQQAIVLTVPASFDEEARELTVDAGRRAGFANLTLLEEPLAALYAWIAGHRAQLTATFHEGALVLVCDVGGGTTDFSLIRTSIVDGEIAFERVAIGEHLLLGGDNLDLALAAQLEQRLGGAGTLSLTQRETLRRKCTAAKERLLTDAGPGAVAITVLGSGRGVVGGGMTVDLSRDEVGGALAAFLPIEPLDAVPSRERRAGLRELGLPYETEPAITRHLAAFLARAAGQGAAARPDLVLFNGGFFTPAIARERVLEALAGWFDHRPGVLENSRPEAAVALGAAFYGRLRRDPAAPKRLLIRAGSARSYYVGLAGSTADAGDAAAICVLPRGTDEGSRVELDREFTVVANQPAAFTLYSSLDRADAAGDVVASNEGLVRHAPLLTAFRYGKRSRRVPLGVRLSVTFTETGTLELWCESVATAHRWRLAFNLRGAEIDPLDGDDEDAGETTGAVVIAEDALARAAARIRAVFAPEGQGSPDTLMGEIENDIGHARPAWPLTAIRSLADVLLELERGRAKSRQHEVRWLNLTGFCVRPGLGSANDAWRVSELRKVYASGLAFPKEIQNQVEWIVLWQRVGAGFNAGQQRELAQRMSGQLGIGQRKPPRLNPQVERESWRLLASLERLDAAQRAKAGDALLEVIRRDARSAAWLWAIGRLGARRPLYGPLNAVVSPAVAERWIDGLLSLKHVTRDTAEAIAAIGARTGDAARDVASDAVERAATRLDAMGFAEATLPLKEVMSADRADTGRVFGESLPEGLRLA